MGIRQQIKWLDISHITDVVFTIYTSKTLYFIFKIWNYLKSITIFANIKSLYSKQFYIAPFAAEIYISVGQVKM